MYLGEPPERLTSGRRRVNVPAGTPLQTVNHSTQTSLSMPTATRPRTTTAELLDPAVEAGSASASRSTCPGSGVAGEQDELVAPGLANASTYCRTVVGVLRGPVGDHPRRTRPGTRSSRAGRRRPPPRLVAEREVAERHRPRRALAAGRSPRRARASRRRRGTGRASRRPSPSRRRSGRRARSDVGAPADRSASGALAGRARPIAPAVPNDSPAQTALPLGEHRLEALAAGVEVDARGRRSRPRARPRRRRAQPAAARAVDGRRLLGHERRVRTVAGRSGSTSRARSAR